jgi:hypothetical protein
MNMPRTQFESIFIESISGIAVNVVVDEMYKVPNSNANLSLKRYKQIFTKLNKMSKCNNWY